MKKIDKIIIGISIVVLILALIIVGKIMIFDRIVVPVELNIYVNGEKVNIASRIHGDWKYNRKDEKEKEYYISSNASDFEIATMSPNNIKIKKEDKVEISFEEMSVFIIGRERKISIDIYDDTRKIVKNQSITTNAKNIKLDIDGLESGEKYYCVFSFSDKDGGCTYAFNFDLI